MAIALDLPKDHPLRATIQQYKKRFEEYSDEYLFSKLKYHPAQKRIWHGSQLCFFWGTCQKQLNIFCSASRMWSAHLLIIFMCKEIKSLYQFKHINAHMWICSYAYLIRISRKMFRYILTRTCVYVYTMSSLHTQIYTYMFTYISLFLYCRYM